MVKHKTADLEGALLDAAVASILDITHEMSEDRSQCIQILPGDDIVGQDFVRFSPSTQWHRGGPIIERERIMIEPHEPAGKPSNWGALVMESYGHEGPEGEHYASGPTPLIAAMRAFVAHKLGDEIDLP